jgi:nitrite reductase/ring-hydroxylating ferredoxin subunit
VTRRSVTGFVEALLRDRRPKAFRPGAEDREAMRAAIALRGARVEDGAPSAQFVDELHDRLRQQLGDPRPVEVPRVWQRRWVLEGAIAASAAAVAVTVDRTVFPSNGPQPQTAEHQLAPDTGTWHTVAPRASLAGATVTRFSTPGAVGFVAAENGTLEAVSGVCSHQGCLPEFNESARRLDCPCHRAAFSLTGTVLFSELPVPPPPLPRLAVREQAGQVQVYLPPPT